MSGSRACSPSRGRRPFRALRADAGGATSVEFGLISGVLFALLFGITDFGYAGNGAAPQRPSSSACGSPR